MLKIIFLFFIVIYFQLDSINGQNNDTTDYEKMCRYKDINDDKMDIYSNKMIDCYYMDDCIDQADDIEVKLSKIVNKNTFAMKCSKKYIDCQKKRRQDIKNQAKMTAEERKEKQREKDKKIKVCI